ncbi:MAG: two-component sensor histidine kinase [Acetobacteraceae bacterium]|nr:two-component sensor histidine kinase [Acetobacteraceae bacterium]
MPFTAWLAASTAMAGVPLLALTALATIGALAPLPALAAATATLAAAMVAAAIAQRDLARLDAALDRAEAGSTEAGSTGAPPRPWLWPLARPAARIDRIARSLARRADEVGAALRASEAIIERLPDPLIALDGARAARRSNAAARAAFGPDIAAVLRHPLLREAIDRAWHHGGPETADLLLPVPVAREVQATVIPFAAVLPDGTRALLVLSDRTRERALERTRADFVANASHELRTPLASLTGFVETLRGPAADDPPAQQRFLAIMAEQAARMSRLIDDLLSLSRIELSEHTPPSDSIDLAALAARVLAGFEVRLAERRQTLAVDIAPNLPRVVADADQIAQVLSNLVDNAMKYGREGGRVAVSVQPVPATNRFGPAAGVVLAVRNDGPGIARVHLPRLTERFYRIDKGRARAAGGTGLGLAIVKHITNRHRGRLAIDSDEGHDTTFSVWLPLTPES